MTVTCRAEWWLWWSVAEILQKLCKNQNKDQSNRLMAMGILNDCAVKREEEKCLSFAAS